MRTVPRLVEPMSVVIRVVLLLILIIFMIKQTVEIKESLMLKYEVKPQKCHIFPTSIFGSKTIMITMDKFEWIFKKIVLYLLLVK